MGKKKKFIEKKKSATFQLLARDFSDPNYNDAPGSDRVFVRVDNNPYSADSFFPDNVEDAEQYPDSVFADAADDADDDGDADGTVFGSSVKFHGGLDGAASGKAAPFPEHVRREILELGFPDDGYNYLIHLREIKNSGGGSNFYQNPKAKLDQLPRDIKAYDASRVHVAEVKSEDANDKSIYSVAEKTVGARLQKVVDPDVAALLDDSDLSRFGSDVEDLDEDFVVQANLSHEGDVDADEELNIGKESEIINKPINEYESSSRHWENLVHQFGEENIGSSSAKAGNDFYGESLRIRRPLDDQFDLLERQEYGSDEEFDGGYIAEEDESIANKLKHALSDQPVDDLELGDKYQVPADLLHRNETPRSKELVDSAADVIRRCVEYAEKYENDDEDDRVIIVEESSDDSEQWDCETIVSTYSNLDNHPAKIGTPEIARKKKLAETVALNATSHIISLRGKERLPVDFLPHSKKSDTERVKSVPGLKNEQQKRKQHGQESKEEKKERKAAVKEEKREARRMKKETKELYRSEAQRAQRVVAIAGPSAIHLM